MRTVLEPAFVLHRRAYRNTSFLLEVLSREYGRLAMIARGASRPKSRLRNLLQPFLPLVLSWSGRGEVYTLTAAEECMGTRRLAPERIVSGLYLNELLIRLLMRHDPHPVLYDAYCKALVALAGTDSEEPILRRFEKILLQELGYGLELSHDAVCGAPIDPGEHYLYQPESGPQKVSGDTVGLVISGKSLLALRDDKLDEPDVLREVKRLTRTMIGVHMDQPLQSRAMLAKLCRRRVHKYSDVSQ